MRLQIARKEKDDIDITGAMSFDTRIEYDKEEGVFYMVRPSLNSVELTGLPTVLKFQAKTGTKIFLRTVLGRIPIFKIKDDTLKKRLAKAVLKEVKVVDGELVICFGM